MSHMILTTLLFISAATAHNASALFRRQSGSGDATYYGDGADPAPTRNTPGACGLNYLPPDPRYFAAINAAQFDATVPNGNPNNAGICGKCARVTCADTKCNSGASTVVYICDKCPGCAYGAIDVSRQAFADLVGGWDRAAQVGRMRVTWSVVGCNGFGPSGGGGAAPPAQQASSSQRPATQQQQTTQQQTTTRPASTSSRPSTSTSSRSSASPSSSSSSSSRSSSSSAPAPSTSTTVRPPTTTTAAPSKSSTAAPSSSSKPSSSAPSSTAAPSTSAKPSSSPSSSPAPSTSQKPSTSEKPPAVTTTSQKPAETPKPATSEQPKPQTTPCTTEKKVVGFNEVTPTVVATPTSSASGPAPSSSPSTASTPASPAKCTESHTVASGDTCWAISVKYGWTVDQLKTINKDINCDNLQVGSSVCVNTGAPRKTCDKGYTVVQGDTCFDIAAKAGMTLDSFYAENPGIQCQVLQIGQTVCVKKL